MYSGRQLHFTAVTVSVFYFALIYTFLNSLWAPSREFAVNYVSGLIDKAQFLSAAAQLPVQTDQTVTRVRQNCW